MAAAAGGCYSGAIDNGFVATSTCQTYSSGRAYCQYYCHDGYVKSKPTVYCAGNDKWIPTGSHPTENAQPCRKTTDPIGGCDDIFFDNGYVVTCPVSGSRSHKDCMYKCHWGFKPASSSVDCVRDQWLTSDTYSDPCIRDGSLGTTTVMTRRPTVSTSSRPRTTYPGYYDDPDLKMDVSPIVFVGAVIGGLIVIGLLIFVIFFRAHRKTIRQARLRSAFAAASDPLSFQNDYTNNNSDPQVDESDFRDIARRILSQSTNQQQQQSALSPPPYDDRSSNIDPTRGQETFSAQSNTQHIPFHAYAPRNPDSINSPTAPPYLEVFGSGNGTTTRDQMQVQYGNRRNRNNSETTRDFGAITDKPPPYHDVQDRMTENSTPHHNDKDVANDQTCHSSFDPPPPYTTVDGNV